MAELARSGHPRILVVDDEQIVLNLVEDTLTDDGYRVTITASANKAVELARNQEFDFILTDIRMPEMNGIEMVKKIHKFAPTIGVIFMTGYANLNTAKLAIKEGAFDYIMKPFELDEIRQAIGRAVEQKQSAAKATLSVELNKITDLSNLMYSSGDLASLLRLSLSFAIIQGDADAGLAAYFDYNNSQICLMEISKLSDGTEQVIRIDCDEGLMQSIPKLGRPVLITAEDKHPLCSGEILAVHREILMPRDSSVAVVVPMARSDKMLGFLTLFHDDKSYELKSSGTKLLDYISGQLTISLENLQLLEDAREAYNRLEQMQDQAIEMEKMATRGQMSAEIGHELNNYLGVVMANFQLMNIRIQKGVTEGLERYTKSIEDHLDKISRFTKGLMDYSSMSQTNFEEVDVNQMLAQIVEFLRPQKRFREFDVEFYSQQDSLMAEIDQGLMEQVFYNLLNNSADASFDAQLKRIEIKTQIADSENISISIKDYGSGISEDRLQKLFNEKFTTKKTGHGIGLMVCKTIIAKHNGQISANSKIDEGTEFVIKLPIQNKNIEEKEETQRTIRETV